MYTPKEIEQICQWSVEYAGTSANRLLLGSNAIPAAYRPAVATQIKLQQLLRGKLPSLNELGIYIPEGINLEQASGEVSACYKQQFVHPKDILLDMTGGLGIDFWAMAQMVDRAVYVEQSETLYSASAYNLPRLLPNRPISLLHGDSMQMLEELLSQHHPSIIYIDPARREDIMGSKRVYAIEDCTPNLYELIERLKRLSQPPRLLVKISPMLDIKHTLEHIPYVRQIEIVAVKSQAKELLLMIDLSLPQFPQDEITIKATDLDVSGQATSFSGTYAEEQASPLLLSPAPLAYIYEPNAALMKSGLYHSLSKRLGTGQLHQHTHLYTSNELLPDFPGRKFHLLEVIPFRSATIKTLKKRIPTSMISCRNFPLKVDALRQKLGIKDGGETMLIGTTLQDGSTALLLCKIIS
ncbi:MAG: hypothetical protein Q4A64_08390 [Porphyromonadaceae bacterium]|nr:hypothetical protein [Porphyromonadaceae bacterium]